MATGSVGDVVGSSTVALNGVNAAGLAGTVSADKTVSLSGVAGDGSAGTVNPVISAILTGVNINGTAGQVIVPLLPNSAIGEVGTVSADREIALTGVASSAAIGSTTLGPRLISLTGNLASGFTGELIAVYWGVIDDSENANWQNIDNSQTPTWDTVANEQTPAWDGIVT